MILVRLILLPFFMVCLLVLFVVMFIVGSLAWLGSGEGMHVRVTYPGLK